jgi:hypothetical protein
MTGHWDALRPFSLTFLFLFTPVLSISLFFVFFLLLFLFPFSFRNWTLRSTVVFDRGDGVWMRVLCSVGSLSLLHPFTWRVVGSALDVFDSVMEPARF